MKARARDAKLLADAGGVVKDTPRQDILPRLETGLLANQDHAARGSLFPQPWLQRAGERKRMDEVAGNGWRLVLASGVSLAGDMTAFPGLQLVDLRATPEADGVVNDWFQRHACVAALVRPDNYVYGVAADANAVSGLSEEASRALGLALCPA